MSLSPAKAIGISPAAKLTDEDKEALKTTEEEIDAWLLVGFIGGPFVKRTIPMHQRTVARLVRRYERPSPDGTCWIATPSPLDGALGKAGDLLSAGAPVEWAIQFVPNWRGEAGLKSV